MSRDHAALIALIDVRLRRGFSWRRGRDCVSFAALCAKVQTGTDLLADLPRWRNRREALALVEAQGGLEAALDAGCSACRQRWPSAAISPGCPIRCWACG